jgi:hypothetical protein
VEGPGANLLRTQRDDCVCAPTSACIYMYYVYILIIDTTPNPCIMMERICIFVSPYDYSEIYFILVPMQ